MLLRHLKTFLVVAESLSITRAAQHVHLAQSSVSEQIQALEADLGVALFDRSQRRLRLTDAGHRLCPHARELLASAEEVRAAFRGRATAMSGTLRVGALETLCSTKLPTLLATFGKSHPSIRFQLSSANSAALREAVASGELDVAFAFGEPPASAELQGEIVGHEDLIAIAPASHPLRRRASVTTEELACEPFLVTGPGCVYQSMFEQAFRRSIPRVVGEFGSLAAIQSLVVSGVGCAVLPRAALGRVELETLRLPWVEGAGAVPISMLWRGRRDPSPPLAEFLDAARNGLGDTHASTAQGEGSRLQG
ncbi:LysR family transcriptional regulator [Lysobacter sp. TAF61]|uniref:LysR family transcriptional regulator n=1 Tax=Lysobacter sp. TAF61 TaxID=3233072 RepID=UPI003F9986AE